ncbi:MAG: SDR family oxidoreductase [Chloroflexota bacterium]
MMSAFSNKYGPWALVTGASSGIGREYALQLAEQGLNVAVLARRKERLDSLVREIESKHQVKTRIVLVDLTAVDALLTIDEATADIEVGLLVNNAGDGVPGAFLKRDVQEYARTIQLNVTIPMLLSHHFGEKMRRRGQGGILFTASTIAYTGAPYLANYSGAKAYMLNFGMALHQELKASGVDVMVLSPGATRTEMADMEGANLKNAPMPWMNADDVARIGIRNLGRKSAVIPGFLNNVMILMMSKLMPRSLAMKMFGSMMANMMDDEIVDFKVKAVSA